MGVGCSHSIEQEVSGNHSFWGLIASILLIMDCNYIVQSSRAVLCYSMDNNGNLGQCFQTSAMYEWKRME